MSWRISCVERPGGRVAAIVAKLVFLLILLGASVSSVARAEVFNTARLLKPGAISLAFEPQLFLGDPVSSEMHLYGGVGLGRGPDLQVRYGFPLKDSGLPQYLGLDLEFGLLRDTAAGPALSLTLGTHVTDWSHLGLDGTLMVSKVFRWVEPYFAVDCNLPMPLDGGSPTIWLVGGLNLHLSRIVEFMAEGGVGMGGSPSFVSMGLNFYLSPRRGR